MADIYTTGATSESYTNYFVTSEATGYPVENVLDFNPDTYWSPTSTSNQGLFFDLGESKAIDSLYVFFNNYTGVTVGSIDLYHSDNGSTWNFVSGSESIVDVTTPNRIRTLTSSSHRYWQVSFTFLAEIIKVGCILFCQTRSLSQSHEFPITDSENFFNKTTIASGGRTFTRGINNSKTRLIARSYKFSGTTDITALENAYYDSKGERFPVILQEGTTNADAHLCKFTNKTFARNETDFQYYQPRVSFQTLPYIDDGDTY